MPPPAPTHPLHTSVLFDIALPPSIFHSAHYSQVDTIGAVIRTTPWTMTMIALLQRSSADDKHNGHTLIGPQPPLVNGVGAHRFFEELI